jgi:hypothetical protein
LWKKPIAHSQNILHVDVLYNIKERRKNYKTVCAELAFAKSSWEFLLLLKHSLKQIKKKNYKFYSCFSAKSASLRRKIKDWLTRNKNNVSEWSDISTHWLLLTHLAKGKVSIYHHLAPVVRRLSLVVCRPLTIHIWIFSSKRLNQIGMKWAIFIEDLP